jgi:hypothetical protein
MELTNWKTLYKSQSFGTKNYGIEIRYAMDREITENDNKAMYRIAEQIENAIMTETMRLDPKEQEYRKEEREKLLALFGDRVDEHFGAGRDIYVEEIPNGYDSSWYNSQRPWFRVTTNRGIITLGWRKRVINISWEPSVGGTAESLFPSEDSTKFERTIHAWSYEKAKAYISTLLQG